MRMSKKPKGIPLQISGHICSVIKHISQTLSQRAVPNAQRLWAQWDIRFRLSTKKAARFWSVADYDHNWRSMTHLCVVPLRNRHTILIMVLLIQFRLSKTVLLVKSEDGRRDNEKETNRKEDK